MFTEDFCSYGVAQLLKEKGFDELCIFKYNSEGVRMKAGVAIDEWQNSELDDDEYSCPSQSMAMKWLREKGLCVVVYPYNSYYEERYEFEIYRRIDENSYEWKSLIEIKNTLFEGYNTCVEAALKYSLENLI